MNKINDYIENINKVLLYIQHNSDADLSVEKLAIIAGFSPFHFHRIFSAYNNEPIYTYIKRVRLEKSANLLKYSKQNITEIAFNCGYNTSSAYTKAFKKFFGVSPSEYKNENSTKMILDRNELYNNLLKELTMENFVETRTIEDFQVLYVNKTGKYSDAAKYAWSSLMKFAYSNRLMNKNTKCIGISYDDPSITSEENLRYDACITFEGNVKAKSEIAIQTIAGGEYAVFLHKGPYENLSTTYNSIFMVWLPNSGKNIRNIPSFEVYLNKDPRRTKPENLRTEIYLPVE